MVHRLSLFSLLISLSYQSDRDDKCLLENMDLGGGTIARVKGVTSTFSCIKLCTEDSSCQAIVWITRTEMCLLKGAYPEHLTNTTWVALPDGGAGVVVFMNCMEAANIAMATIQEVEQRKMEEVVAEEEGNKLNEAKSTDSPSSGWMEQEHFTEIIDEDDEEEAENKEEKDSTDIPSSEWKEQENPTEIIDEEDEGGEEAENKEETSSTDIPSSEWIDQENPTEIIDEDEEQDEEESFRGEGRKTVQAQEVETEVIRVIHVEETPVGGGGGNNFQIPPQGWSYNPHQSIEWVQSMLEPVFSWWSWSKSNFGESREEGTAFTPLTSTSPTSSTSSSSSSSSSSSFSSTSTSPTTSTSSGSTSFNSNPSLNNPIRDKLLEIFKSVQYWTLTSVRDIFVAIGQAASDNSVVDRGNDTGDDDCVDSARSCGSHLCEVEVTANMCKKSCGICPSPGESCRNMYSDTYCSFSEGMGYCKHREIAANCKKSCGICPENCEDTDSEFCEMYGRFHCWNEDVRNLCSKSCFLC